MMQGRWKRTARILLSISMPLLGCLAACGGGESIGGSPPPPPPPPVVTSILVTPAQVTIAVEDTVRLAATAKDQNGNVLSGKTPTWGSANATIATISAEGVVTGVGAGQTTITATVDGKQGTAQLTVTPLVRVPVDLAASKTKTVSYAGDTITVTASTGVVYVLEIPANALDSAVPITMTPVKQFKHLPLSGGLVGAVELAPAGLRFHVPATLRIKTSPTVAAGQKLVALHYGAGGEVLVSAPARLVGGEVSLLIDEVGVSVGASSANATAARTAAPVNNASGSGAALGTAADLSALPIPPTTPQSIIAQTQLAGLSMPADQAAILTVMRGAYFRSVQNAAAQATTPTALRDAIFAWAQWRFAVSPLDTPTSLLSATLIPEARFLYDELIRAFKRIRPGLDQQCISQRDPIAGFNVLTLQGTLLIFDELNMLAPAGIDRSAVLASSCVQVFVSQQQFPDPATPNQASPLDLRFGLKFGTDPALLNTVFALRFDVTGSTHDGRFDNTTDDLGKFSTQVTPNGQTSLTVKGFACVPDTTNRFAFDLCASIDIQRAFGRVIDGSVTITTDAGLAQISDVAKVTGQLVISGSGITSTDLRELSVLSEVGRLVVAGLPNLTSLAGMKSLAGVNSLRLSSNPSMTSLAGLDRIQSVLSLELLFLDELQLVGPLLSLQTVHDLHLVNLPKVQSLAGLRGVSVTPFTSASRAIIEISGLTALNSLTDLQPLPTVFPGDLILRRLPLVGTYGFLAGVTEIVGNLRLTDFATTPPGLDGLTKVDGELQIAGVIPAFTGLPNLVDVGLLLLVDDGVTTLGQLTLPALTTIDNRLEVREQTPSCPRTGPLRINLPTATRIDDLRISNSQPVSLNCQVDLLLPKLAATGGQVNLDFNGLHDVTLGPLTGDVMVLIDRNATLVALRFTGPFNIRSISIEQDQLLQTITGPGGSLSAGLTIRSNPNLSQAAAEAWAAKVTAQRKTIQGNKSP